jgi:homoserine kinase type II
MALPFPPAIVRAYSLHNASLIGQFESYGNENWLVEDERRRRFVLRRHRLNGDIARLELQLALQQHLRRNGFPATTVIETEAHHPFAIDADGVPWVLFGLVPGAEYDFASGAQVTSAARCLAQFHLLTESFGCESAPSPEYKTPIRHCWMNAEDDLRELDALFAATAREELDWLATWWRSVLAEWPLARLDALPSGWLHGDYHGRNLIFDGDRAIGVFDFDDVDRGPYVFDLAGGFVKFGREGRGSTTLRPDFARTFVGGYDSLRPLSLEERAALPVMAAMGYPPNPKHYRYWRDRHSESIVHRFRREVATIRTLHAQLEHIGTVLFL